MSTGKIPQDDRGKAVLALWNDATQQAIPVHVGALVTGSDGQTYAKLDANVTIANANANGQSTMANSAPVVIASNQTPLRMATGTTSNVASSASSVTLLASNANRTGFTIWNDSTQLLYLLFKTGGTASTTSYSLQIGAQQGFIWDLQPVWTGDVIGIWAAANGNARVTEFTA